jgi:cell division protein FtsZ
VVATGIDHALTQRAAAAPAQTQQQPQASVQALPPQLSPEARIAQVAQRMRADNERLVEREEGNETMRPSAAAPQTSATDPIESAKAAMAAAIMPQSAGPDVTIRPLAPKPSLFIDPAPASAEPDEPETFIPPQPERVPNRTMRMPRVDELPVPAQNEIRARRGEYQPEQHHPEKRRMTLLQRLAAVGLGRQEQAAEEEMPPAPRSATLSPAATERLPGRPAPRSDSRPEPVSEYAKRGAPQGLDPHGRQVPVHNRSEEDQLDIPAFLRRQAN